MNKYIIGLLTFLIVYSCGKPVKVTLGGLVFGTSYSIQYYSNNAFNLEYDIDSLFSAVNTSMSTYQADSDISKLNRNVSNTVDDHFVNVFDSSQEIYLQTKGAFDPTIGNLVNAWDFGPEGKISNLDSLQVDSLMLGVGFDKVKRQGYTIIKENLNTYIDFNAIAKGYGVDVIAEFLESRGVDNYLVEIGGEIRTKGRNVEKDKSWKVGVEMPHFDGSQSIIKAISLNSEAMATSGTYRKYRTDNDGNRYSHIIDTKTGYPSKTNLLSISVIASNCMIADAYATAFKTMGIAEVKKFLEDHKELKAFLIFENANRELETLGLNEFPEY